MQVRNRGGFTLVEMLVTIGILLLLMTITLAVVNVSMSEDRVIGAANTLQSFLEGARNRAIFAGRPVGVRFLKDQNDPTLVTGVMYIEQPEPFAQGSLSVDASNPRLVHGVQTGGMWYSMKQKGLLKDGAWLTMWDGNRYTIFTDTLTPTNETLRLTRDSAAPGGTAGEYQLQIQPVTLPNMTPRELTAGVVIPLDESQVPYPWGPFTSGPKYAEHLDIMFSPRGSGSGYTGSGVAHFSIMELEDVTLGNGVSALDRKGPVRIVTVKMSTGAVHVSDVDMADSNNNGQADDPFAFAAMGQ